MQINIININDIYMLYPVYARILQVLPPKPSSWIHVPARDSRGLSILRKRSCDKSATNCYLRRQSMESTKNRYFYVFILYKLFTRVFFFSFNGCYETFNILIWKLALSMPMLKSFRTNFVP